MTSFHKTIGSGTVGRVRGGFGHGSGRAWLRSSVIGPLLGLWVSGCAGNAVERPFPVIVDTLTGGGLFVHNGAVGTWDDKERWRLEEDLRIGGTEGDTLEFGRLGALTVDDRGRIWVSDLYAANIHVFDSQGRHLRTIGRRGEGPGELQTAMALAQAPDGTIWASDPRAGRYEVFDTSGRYVTSHARPVLGNEPTDPIVFDSTGLLVHRAISIRDPRGPRPAIRRNPSDLGPVDTLPPVTPLGAEKRFSEWSATRQGSPLGVIRPVPFAHQPGMRLQPGRSMYIAWPGRGEYRFGALRLDGDTILMIERAAEPISIPGDVIDDYLSGMPGANALDRGEVPESYPPFEEVDLAPDGHWWVRRTMGPDQVAYEVFDPAGVYLGQVETELDLSRFDLMQATADALYGTWRGTLDVPSVVRLRVVKP